MDLLDKYKQAILRSTVIDEYKNDCLALLLAGEVDEKEYNKMIKKADEKEEEIWKKTLLKCQI